MEDEIEAGKRDRFRGNTASLHGESAARRQAITDLLFFASVADLVRCKKICATWQIDPADPATADYDKRTPLHLACAEGCYAVATWLLDDCGAEVNPVDRFKRTPLEDAVRGDHGEMAGMLVAHGGKIMGKDGTLIDLADSPLSGNVRIFGEIDPEWEVNPKHLVLGDKVGEGEFGVVYKAKYFGTTVAVKVLKDMNAVSLGDFRTELNVLQKVHHPHMVQFLGAVTKQVPYMIITEFMGCGSMADILRSGELPTMRRSAIFALDCARGMAYLHNHHPLTVIHRDLKPANLMVGSMYTRTALEKKLMVHDVGILKIADFGLSKSMKIAKPEPEELENPLAVNGGSRPVSGGGSAGGAGGAAAPTTSYKLTGETGSYRYMAPEVFRHELYNHKVDQYAFAMILYQLFEGVPPFQLLDPIQAARAASHGARPQWDVNKKGRQVPPRLRQLVESCWAADYEMRPEFTHIIGELERAVAEMPGDNTFSVMAQVEGSGGGGCCSLQ